MLSRHRSPFMVVSLLIVVLSCAFPDDAQLGDGAVSKSWLDFAGSALDKPFGSSNPQEIRHSAALRALRIHFEPMDEIIYAAGDVELSYDGILLRATEMQYQIKDGWVMAPYGATIFVRDELKLTGDFLRYNLDEKRGELLSAKASYGSFNFEARKANVVGNSALLEGSRITTCDKHHPHYELFIKRAQLLPDGKATLDGLSVRIYGLQLPSLPRQSIRLTRGKGERLPLQIQFNSTDGIYVGWDYLCSISGLTSLRPTVLYGLLGLSWKERWRGKLALTVPWSNGELRLSVAHKDTVSGELTEGLLLDISPEFGVSAVIKPSKSFLVHGDLSYGRYVERLSGRTSSPKLNFQVMVRAAESTAKRWRWNFDLLLRYSRYKHDMMRIARLMAGVEGGFGNRFEGKLSVIHHVQSGRTPFEFDDIDIPTEFRLSGIAWIVRERWKLIYDMRYDASNWEMRDWSAGVVYRAHCIEWGLSYNLSRREVRLIVDLVGITTPK